MLNRITDQPAVGKLIAQYDQMPRRDQQALTVLGIAILLALLYFAVWRPAAAFHEDGVSARENAEDLLAWIESNRSTIERLATQGGATRTNAPESGRALMSLVTSSASEAGLSLQRFEPSGNDAIRVWLENAPFTEVAGWLENLTTEHGVIIDQAALDRREAPGLVSVRLTLTI